MARQIHSRLKITGELIAETPLHVGGYGESFETDMALARNGRDEFYIPGTSLAGSLRNWFAKNFPAEVKKLWGDQDDNNGHASFVLVEDLQLPKELQSAVQSELRDGVGIDRCYGTAADKAKFDRTILPRGTRLKVEMTVDLQNDTKRIKAMFGHLLAALQNGNIRLGASKTRGLGKVKFEPKKIEEYLLNGFDAMLNAVEKKPAKTYANIEDLKNEDTTITSSGSQFLTITINWQPKSALMVKAGYEGIGVDMLPLTSGNGKNKVSLCLPGSSIKGAFRAQAERIVRTIKPEKFPRENEFHEQIKVDLINELFGAKKERNGLATHLGLGALSIDDCYFGKQMNVAEWQAVENGKTTETSNGKEVEVTYLKQKLWQALKKIEGELDLVSPTKDFAISHHVAIDRWTGGAAEGALYSVLQPTVKSGWQEICLTLDVSRLPDKLLRKKCLMLLLLVLRDFAENRLPLGFATNRGMGEVMVNEIKGLDVIPKLLGLEGKSFAAKIENEKLIFEGDEVKETLKGVLSYE